MEEQGSLDNKGFSLFEIVIAMTLVVLVMVPVLASLLQSSVFSRRVDMTYTASCLAQRRIELLKGFETDDLNAAAETEVGIDQDNDGSNDYTRSTEITEDYDGMDGLVKVKVTVKMANIDMSGKRGGAMVKPVVMETIFFKGFEDD